MVVVIFFFVKRCWGMRWMCGVCNPRKSILLGNSSLHFNVEHRWCDNQA